MPQRPRITDADLRLVGIPEHRIDRLRDHDDEVRRAIFDKELVRTMCSAPGGR